MRITNKLGLSVALLVAATACTPSEPGTPADAIYVNANVVTMNDAQPRAEAIAIKDGQILAVGTRRDVEAHRGQATTVTDLEGRTVTPGFIDGHGHLSAVGVAQVAANLNPPPDGKVDSVAALQQSLRDWMSTSTIPERYGVIFGFGYDDSQLAELRHPTRDELDAVSTDLPVYILHQSGHLGAANSKALEIAGLGAATPDPAGGVIQRRTGSQEPNGVLEEAAHFGALAKIVFVHLGPEQALATTRAGLEAYASFGYTTAQDGGTTPGLVAGYAAAAEQQALTIDVVSYVYTHTIRPTDTFMQGPYFGRQYNNGYRIAGVKLNLDGSPQGKTAWLTQPYFEPPPGKDPSYRGYPAFENEQVVAYLEQAFENDWQVMAHVNGDAAVDQYLDALAEVNTRIPVGGRRTIAIHAQTARADQLDRMKELEVMPSFFAAHTFYWGDWHRDSVLGPERAANISPTGWARERDMIFTSHHDAPIIPPNAMRVLWATVNRTTRSGLVLGPDQRVDPETGLKALTIWAAWQSREEDRKGSIEAGKLADLVVLSDDPLTIDPAGIADITVLRTIKNGQEVYRAGGGQ
jgi:predicted amidohydrolase YtcJ